MVLDCVEIFDIRQLTSHAVRRLVKTNAKQAIDLWLDSGMPHRYADEIDEAYKRLKMPDNPAARILCRRMAFV